MKHSFIFILYLLLLLPIVAQAQVISTESTGTVNGVAYSTAQIIQGRVSGVSVRNIDGSPNGALLTSIRGLNSLRGDSQPLWIVDGAELNSSMVQNLNPFWQDRFADKGFLAPLNELDFLSPYQIESIEVIKDVSATSLYGAKGANGVIIVRTKRLSAKDSRELRWNSNVSLNKTLSHNHTVLLSQNVNNTGYSFSAFFRENQGSIPNLPGRYASLKANFETKANPVVHFGVNTIANLGRTNSTLGTARYGELSRTLTMRYPDMTDIQGLDGQSAWVNDYKDFAESYRSVSSFFLNLNFFHGFSLKTKAGCDYQYQDRYVWYGGATSLGNAFNGAASIVTSSLLNYNASAFLSFDRHVAKSHLIGLYAGADIEGGLHKYGVINATDFTSYELGAKGISFGSSKNEPNTFTMSVPRISILGHLFYDFRGGIVRLDASLRANTTPKFDEGRFGLYPSAQLSADLRKAFLSGSDAVSSLSLGGGFGMSESERSMPFPQYSSYTGGDIPPIQKDVEIFYDAFNRIVSSEWHAELCFGFLKDRITGKLQYYDKLTDDVLNLYDNSEVKKKTATADILRYGPRKIMQNASSVVGNRGFELDLAAAVIKKRAVDFNVYANAACNINQIVRMNEASPYNPEVGKGVAPNVSAMGYAVSSFYGYRTGSDGEYLDQTGEGMITPADRLILGSPLPVVSGSLGMSLRIIGFNLDLRFDGAAGHDILDMNSMLEDGAVEVSDVYVCKGDYVRLANIGLSYNFNVGKKALKAVKLSLSAHNLFSLSKYKGWNCEANCFGFNNLNQGIDYGSYPSARIFAMGVQFDF